MGIEPTSRTVNARPSGFEDRGRHQASRHFQSGKYIEPAGDLRIE